MVVTNLLWFVLIFGNAFDNRICLEHVLSNVIFECERPLLIEYKDLYKPYCKGTVGSEAGDLSEPAVRRNSHRLKTI